MSHFTVLVLVPADTKRDAIEDAITARLARYDENTEVEPYKRYMDAQDIANMVDHYKVEATDTAALVTHMEDWYGYEGGADETGLYYLCTYNPDSHWDWWQIGGRWDREMQGKNVLPVADWDGSFQPFALVTDDGEWHQKARMG